MRNSFRLIGFAMDINRLCRTHRISIVPMFSLALQMLITWRAQSQTYIVDGSVSSMLTPVRYASVIFIDTSDTTRTFSTLTNTSGRYTINIITTIKPYNNLPVGFELEQNYPNPFLSSTEIPYQLHTPSDVQVTIYDILGRETKQFSLRGQAAGAYSVQWDGKDNFGKGVAAGVYFYRMQTKGESQVKKMVLGIGNAMSFASRAQARSPMMSKSGEIAATHLSSVNYRVQITNTDSTFPRITPTQISNVVVQRDTTLNFTVSSTNFFPAIVYVDSVRQAIRGFGAANILPWRPDMTASQINKAFGTGTGQIGLTILRLRVPSDTTQFGPQVPTAQAAYALGVKIIASPWSPPPSMKTNNNIVGGSLRTDSYAAYAAHLGSFANYMSNNGVPLFAISVQNEPDISVTYESCDWNASQMFAFVRTNAPAVGRNIIIPESFNFNHAISDTVLNDSVAAAHVSIIGGHIYGGGLASYPLALSKGKEIWMTEHLDTDTTWSHVFATAKEINDCMNADMSAYIWWYIVRFYGPIDESGNVTKRGYIMSQFARFIRPGSNRVKATFSPQANVNVTAYKNGTSVIIVAHNSSVSIAQTFVLQNVSATSVVPYATSSTRNCVQGSAINVVGGTFTATLDAQSVTTFVSN